MGIEADRAYGMTFAPFDRREVAKQSSVKDLQLWLDTVRQQEQGPEAGWRGRGRRTITRARNEH
jgi:hypothetical protein